MGIAVRKTEEVLRGFVAQRSAGANHAVPLKSVAYDVEIVSGVALVKQKRVFRNEETFPIEATLTFPVGYDAVVSEVTAIVDGRTLKGVAKAKAEARETYEKALDEGKATVLHEELMRGLHMMSVGNIASGAEIVVEVTSVSPIALVEGTGRIRVPMTIGAIYGTSPLLPSDDIVADGIAMEAEVKIRGADGIKVNGQDVGEVATVKTSGVLDVSMPSVPLFPIQSRMPSGSWAKLSFSSPTPREVAIDADLLLDASGSMNERVRGGSSKWDEMVKGLSSALESVLPADVFGLWTFSNACRKQASVRGAAAAERVRSLDFDGGGTELASSVHEVARSRSEGNILLVTDGRSYTQIDFDLVKKSGARFTVVLIGRGSFEARVAQLAAITGGQMFIVDTTDDVAGVVRAAMTSMRSPASPIKMLSSAQSPISRQVGGLAISVEYSDDRVDGIDENEAVAPFVAGLAVQGLPDKKAAKLAEATGIVSHLTSIVMVDQDGPEVDGIAVNRKVSLAQSEELDFMAMSFSAAPVGSAPLVASLSSGSPLRSAQIAFESFRGGPVSGGYVHDVGTGDVGDTWLGNDYNTPVSGLPPTVLRGRHPVMTKITTTVETEYRDLNIPGYHPRKADIPSFQGGLDWVKAGEVINGCPLSTLGIYESAVVGTLAGNKDIVALAASLGMDAIHVALAILAQKFGSADRHAQRIVRKVLAKADPTLLSAALSAIG